MKERISVAVCETMSACEQSLARGKLWGTPLLAFARAHDERFALLKQSVSPSHLLPVDVLPGAKTVVCFFVPFDKSVPQSNEAGGEVSPQWARAYVFTNGVIKQIGEALAALFAQSAFRCGQIPATHNFDERRLVSDWSHRHVAAIAGLGAFGLNNMLITQAGCCGRFGSLVTDWEAPPDAVSAAPVVERCLRKRGGGCGLCQKRCPAGAYPDGAFDRFACYERCLHSASQYRELGLADVCGKCLCGLPCSTRSP